MNSRRGTGTFSCYSTRICVVASRNGSFLVASFLSAPLCCLMTVLGVSPGASRFWMAKDSATLGSFGSWRDESCATSMWSRCIVKLGKKRTLSWIGNTVSTNFLQSCDIRQTILLSEQLPFSGVFFCIPENGSWLLLQHFFFNHLFRILNPRCFLHDLA